MVIEENEHGEQGSFELLMKKLEECASQLDKGGVSLEEALNLYEEGMSVAAEASKRLKTAELRISKIKSSYQREIVKENIDDLV